MPIYCPKCGTQNSDWAQTCQQCSSPLPSRPQAEGYGAQQPPAPPASFPPAQNYQQQPAPYGSPYGGGGYQQSGGGFGGPANYAGIGKRFVAHLLDGLVVAAGELPGFLLFMLAAIIAGSSSGDPGPVVGLLGILAWLAIFAGGLGVWLYNINLLGRDGATLGKRWMRIKVLDQSNQPLGFGKAFLREIVKGFVGLCFILLLWPLWDAEKQGLYDKLFGTHVYEA